MECGFSLQRVIVLYKCELMLTVLSNHLFKVARWQSLHWEHGHVKVCSFLLRIY